MRFFKSISILLFFAALMVMVKPVAGCKIAGNLTGQNRANASILHKLLSKRKQDFLCEELRDETDLTAKAEQIPARSFKTLLPTYIGIPAKITRSILLFLRNSLSAPPPLYLFTHSLSI